MVNSNPRSTARISGHPIHPMLIPFPVAFFVATFAVDLVYLANGEAGWASAAIWLLGAGLVMAILAVPQVIRHPAIPSPATVVDLR